MRRCPPLPRRSQNGLTLIELLTVLSIVAIASLVVLPALAPTQPHALDLAVHEFADAIRAARSEALRTDNPHGVHIEGIQGRIRVFRGDPGTMPPNPLYDVPHPLTKRPYEIVLATDTSGIAVTRSATWSAVCGQPDLLGFDAAGTPRCGDPWAVLLQTSTVTLTLAGHTRRVVVDGETGRVTVQ